MSSASRSFATRPIRPAGTRNVLEFCDSVLVADHGSTDGTPRILDTLSAAHDHLEVHRINHSAESHALVEAYAGTDTWILSVDGDELYDPAGSDAFEEISRGCLFRRLSDPSGCASLR